MTGVYLKATLRNRAERTIEFSDDPSDQIGDRAIQVRVINPSKTGDVLRLHLTTQEAAKLHEFLGKHLAEVETNDPILSIFPGQPGSRSQWLDERACGCWTCVEEVETARAAKRGTFVAMPFIVCPKCGNKRCPKATNHILECTGSNRTNQPGSRHSISE